MKKIVKKYGDTLIISFTKDEARVYDIKEGDVLDLDDILTQKKCKEVT